MVTKGGWTPKRSLDRESRRAKAAKIAALIEQRRPIDGAELLEIGTGAGIITSLLAERVGDDGSVWSVDIADLRTVTQGYQFRLVDGVELPFGDDSFDIVVSNHTIEHVGGPNAQRVHLQEIARVLRSDGVGYLASPTRWALVEPHFKVPLLSWLPAGVRTPALRLTRRGSVYDISPRTRRELLELIDDAGLRATEVTIEALRVSARVEPGLATNLASSLPAALLDTTRPAIPTMIFLLGHDSRHHPLN